MGKTAFIFPGQGAQTARMAMDFYEKYDSCKAVIDKAQELLDFDLKAVMFEENELLNKTEYTQAAILAAECCILKAVEEKGIQADLTAGLSLGEYSSLVAAGVLSFEDAILLVRKRGIYMEHEVPAGLGGMAAVISLDADVIDDVCAKVAAETGKVLQAANYNCPGQIVISGDKDAVLASVEPLKAAGARMVTVLNVSGPFHSLMLKGAGEKLGEELKHVTLNAPVIPYVANVDGGIVNDTSNIKELLEKQVYSSVRWQQCMETLIAEGVTEFYEIGPGKTLAGFMKRIDKTQNVITINTVSDLEAVQV